MTYESTDRSNTTRLGVVSHGQETLSVMLHEGVKALLLGRLHIMSRSNWTGCDMALQSAGLPVAIHGLLGAAYLRAFPEPPAKAPRPAQVGLALPIADIAAPLEDEPADEPMGEEAMAGEARDLEHGGDDKPDASIWREESSKRVRSTRSRFLSGAVENDIGAAAIAFAPLKKRILRQLALSGERWEKRQQKSSIDGKQRLYHMLVASDADYGNDLIAEAFVLLLDDTPWLPLSPPPHGSRPSSCL